MFGLAPSLAPLYDPQVVARPPDTELAESVVLDAAHRARSSGSPNAVR